MKKTHAIVRKRVESESEYGTEILTWENSGRISGFMDFLTVSKGEIAQKIVSDSTHIFICETNLPIEQGDRLYINEIGFEVNFVDRPMYGKQAEIELKPIMQNNSETQQDIYFGVITEEDINEVTILNLDNQEMKNKSFTKELEAVDGTLLISYSKSFGKASIRLNNKPVTNWTIQEIMVNGTLYYTYVVSVEAGTLNIELF